jgi:hypothetical protein
MAKKELVIKKEISTITEKVQAIGIASKEDMSSATELLSKVNVFLDGMTEEKERLTKPLNEALREIRSRYKPTELVMEQAIADLKKKMGAYQMEQLAIQKKEQDKIAQQLADGKIKKISTAINKIANVDAPDAKVLTDDGSASFRPVKKFEVVDITILPIEYHLADESKIRKAMQAGVELAGVRYYEELSVVNRR